MTEVKSIEEIIEELSHVSTEEDEKRKEAFIKRQQEWVHAKMVKIAKDHGFDAYTCLNSKDEEILKIEMPWTNSEKGTEGIDHIEVSSVKELYDVLGY